MGVVYTRRVATDIPRLKPPAGDKYVIVCCVTGASVRQSLNGWQTHLLGVKLHRELPTGNAIAGGYAK